ncbi:hypothetical protein NHX12_018141 [Muraenolepis orangiensis]|uniref:G-protein coupled receptors family 3 profile domain-containing protein n=1 Tax=Muraenolepis orangiensis TaxID=630683 RepID=A0A9Q0EWG4_9TELE|nr:hypothetical protein NHX12_018141 [Muraenolepis orangiensis]
MSAAMLLLLLPPLLLLLIGLPGNLTSGAAVGAAGVENPTPTDPPLNSTGAVEDALPVTPDPSGSERPAPEVLDRAWIAESFLYSGDPMVLASEGCSRGYRPDTRSSALPGGLYGPLGPAVDALANAANFLNLVFQASDLREASMAEDMEWYHAMTRALLVANPLIRRSLLTFDAEPDAATPQLVLLATRGPGLKVGTILLQDLTKAWKTLHPPGSVTVSGPASDPDDSWFSSLKVPGPGGQPLAALSKWVLFNDLATLDTPKWVQGDSYVTNRSGVRWANGPFLECKDGHFLPAWLLTLSTSFYGLKPDLTPEFRGVIRVDVDIQSIDIDQCAVGEGWFADTHQCNRTSMEGAFMALVFISMLAAYRHRRSKRIRASGLLLLETILFGSLLLYFPVFILSFQPSTFRCILLRWVRMTGFSIVYGTITLKMYRVLRVFLSRTAQRVPYMSSLHLLRILGVMLVTVCWFLCAWTVGVLQNRERNIPVLVRCETVDGQRFAACSMDCWDYMMSVAELLLLCWGSSLCSVVKPVPSAFHEPRYMGIAIHNELLLSATFQLLRFMLPSLHPDWMLLLSFTHTHVTTTVTLALLFIPKFLHVSQAGREEIAAEVYEDEVDLQRSGSYLNSSFQSAWSDHTLEPDDIRDELKKLYAQLEVHKTKKMTQNNPHLSKKRSSRLPGLGRSIIKRIAEIPESVSRQCSREDRDFGHYSRGVAQSDSFRKGPDTVSISYTSMNTHSPVMRKSHSEYDYAKEPEASLRDSMLRPNILKRASQRSETDSLDIPPGVCKSASAQNLTIDNNLLHPDHTKLHKSRSLTSTNTHSIEDVTMVNRANSMITRSRQQMTIKEQTTCALKSQSFDKTEVCPWELVGEPPVDRNQRHVTYAYAVGGSVHSPDDLAPNSPKVHVCPWDYAPPPEASPAVERRVEGECDSPKSQTCVSASAPGTPRPMVSKDQRVFSFRNTTEKWLSVKALIGSVDAHSMGAGSKRGSIISQLSQESTSTTRSATCTNPGIEKKTLPKRSLTTVDGKPCLVKQSAIRLSSGDSSDRSPRRLTIGKSAIHPWDSLEMQKDNTYENVFSSRQNSIHSNTSSWGTGGSNSRTPSTHRRSSIRLTPSRNMSTADVCPWDAPQGQALQKQLSTKANVCPWEAEETQASEQTSVCPWELREHETIKRQGSAHSNICPWETQDAPTTPRITVIQQSQSSQQSLGRDGDVCPWDSTELPQPLQRHSDVVANVCPWDIQEDQPEVGHENIKPSEMKSLLKVPSAHENKPPTTLSAPSTALQVSKTTESCPWEFPDPPKNFADSCDLVGGERGLSLETSSIKSEVCPWDTGHEDKSKDSLTDVCPWESVSVHVEETDSPRTNVCPWEMAQPDDNPTIEINVANNMEKNTSLDSVRIGVCPWESEDVYATKSQAFKSSSVSLVSQDTARANVCSLEKEPVEQKVQGHGGSLSDFSPGGGNQQEGVPADVCPWETGEPALLKKQDSGRVDVCPWETGEQETLKKQDSGHVDVCPWETGEPESLKNQDSGRVDVCPWEIGEQETLKKQDSGHVDVCPWETGEQETLKKQDSGHVDVCPWETGEPESLKKQDSGHGDVCPWETREPEPLKKQDSVHTEVCPWETKDPQNLSASKTDINSSNLNALEPQAPVTPEEPTMDSGTDAVEEAKANLPLGRRDALCPWQMDASLDNTSDVFTWEPENIPEEDEEEADAECEAEAFVFPSDL